MKYILRALNQNGITYRNVGYFEEAKDALRAGEALGLKFKVKPYEHNFTDVVMAFTKWDGTSDTDSLFELAHLAAFETIYETANELGLELDPTEWESLRKLSA